MLSRRGRSADVAHRCAFAGEAIDVARRVGDELTLLSVMVLVMSPLHTPDTLGRMLEETKLALALSERVADAQVRFQDVANRLNCRAVTGDIDEADTCLAELDAIAERTGLLHQRWHTGIFHSWRNLLAGKSAMAEAGNNEVFEIGTKMGVSVALTIYGANLLRISLGQGMQMMQKWPVASSKKHNAALTFTDIAVYSRGSNAY